MSLCSATCYTVALTERGLNLARQGVRLMGSAARQGETCADTEPKGRTRYTVRILMLLRVWIVSDWRLWY